MFKLKKESATRSRAITITPIPREENGSGAYTNYQASLEIEKNGGNACWTDAPENDSKVGDLFAFITGAGSFKSTPYTIEVRQIVSIPGPQSEITVKSWIKGKNSYNDTGGTRNFLVLGPVLGHIDWEVLCEILGWTPYTKKVNKKDPNDPYRTPVQKTQSITVKI